VRANNTDDILSPMRTVRFRATPTLKSWLHSKRGGRKVTRQWGEPTTIIEKPLIMRDGDEVEMDDSPENDEVAWVLTHHPANFELVELAPLEVDGADGVVGV